MVEPVQGREPMAAPAFTGRVLMITSEWPTPDKPYQVPFIVRQVNFLRKAGVDLHVFPFRGGKNPSNYARAWRRVQAEIQRGQFDLIHAQWGQSGLLALPKRLPLVVTFRGDDLEGIIGPSGQPTMYGRVLQMLSRMVARQADQVILVADRLAKQISRRDYHIIPSGLDLDLFRPMPQEQARRRLGLSLHKRYVLFAGSVGNPRKRYELAKQAVEMLKRNLATSRASSETQDVELLVAANVMHDQVPLYMNASDALLLVSLHEGSPNVVKEALACNLPVVTTDVGDVRSRLENVTGSTILQDDTPIGIAAALAEVLRQQQRPNSRPTVSDLDENHLTDKVIQVYRNSLVVSSKKMNAQGEMRKEL